MSTETSTDIEPTTSGTVDTPSNKGGVVDDKPGPQPRSTRTARVINRAKTGTRAAADGAKSLVGKYATRETAMAVGKFAVKRAIPVVGTALLVADAYELLMGQEEILHHQPENPRTKFLPVARNGDIDNPHGDAPNSVDSMDKHIAQINEQTFQFDPPEVCSYCDDGCDQGCNEVTAGSLELDADTAATPIENWANAVQEITSALGAYTGEMWADRLLEVYGPNGSAGIPDLMDKTDAVAEALRTAVRTSDDMGVHAFDALRESIRAGREEMNQRVKDENSAWGWVGDALTHSRGDGAFDRLKEKTAKVHEAAQENDGAVKALNDALDAWAAKPANDGKGGNTNPHSNAEHLKDEPSDTAPPPPDSTIPSPGDTPLPGDAPPADDWDKKLDDLLNSKGDNTSPFDGLGGGDPLGGGGMPGGGMPGLGGGGMPDLGGGAPPLGGGTDPFGQDGANPLADPKDIEDDAAADPLDDTDDDDDSDDDDGKDGDDDKKDGDDDNKGGTDPDPAVAADVTPPVDGQGDVPDVHSDDVTARTATLPDGRAITFDDPKTAQMVRNLVAAEDGSPKSVYAAASEAGFDLPPQGQDIGKLVQPGDMQPGDVVVGPDHKSGIYLGNDDVLMEDKSVQKVSELGDFSGPNQGVFHLDSGVAGGDSAPSQPLGSGADLNSDMGSTSTPGQVNDQAGSPGVPSDDAAPVQDTTAAPFGNGTSSNTGGMDPSTAFPS